MNASAMEMLSCSDRYPTVHRWNATHYDQPGTNLHSSTGTTEESNGPHNDFSTFCDQIAYESTWPLQCSVVSPQRRSFHLPDELPPCNPCGLYFSSPPTAAAAGELNSEFYHYDSTFGECVLSEPDSFHSINNFGQVTSSPPSDEWQFRVSNGSGEFAAASPYADDCFAGNGPINYFRNCRLFPNQRCADDYANDYESRLNEELERHQHLEPKYKWLSVRRSHSRSATGFRKCSRLSR